MEAEAAPRVRADCWGLGQEPPARVGVWGQRAARGADGRPEVGPSCPHTGQGQFSYFK